jgi:hypothetical protein
MTTINPMFWKIIEQLATMPQETKSELIERLIRDNNRRRVETHESPAPLNRTYALTRWRSPWRQGPEAGRA